MAKQYEFDPKKLTNTRELDGYEKITFTAMDKNKIRIDVDGLVLEVPPISTIKPKDFTTYADKLKMAHNEWRALADIITKTLAPKAREVDSGDVVAERLSNYRLFEEDGKLYQEFGVGEKAITVLVSDCIPTCLEILQKGEDSFMRIKTGAGVVKDIPFNDFISAKPGACGFATDHAKLAALKTWISVQCETLPKRTILNKLGWHQDAAGNYGFVHYGGIIGNCTISPQDIELDAALLYQKINVEDDSVKMLKEFLDIGNVAATTPAAKHMFNNIFLVKLRAHLIPLFLRYGRSINFVQLITAITASYKTSITNAINNFTCCYPTLRTLVSFESTGKATVFLLSQVRHDSGVADDFIARRESDVQSLNAAIAAGAEDHTRSGMKQSGTQTRRAIRCEGVVQITGESIAATGSRAGRILYVDAPSKGDWDTQWTSPRQGKDYSAAGRGWLEWLSTHMDSLELNLPDAADRVDTAIGELVETARIFDMYCKEVGVNYDLALALESLDHMKEHSHFTRQDRDDFQQFIGLFRDMYDADKIGISPGENSRTENIGKIVGDQVILFSNVLIQALNRGMTDKIVAQTVENHYRVKYGEELKVDGRWTLSRVNFYERFLGTNPFITGRLEER